MYANESASSPTSIIAGTHHELNSGAFLRILKSWAKLWVGKDMLMMQTRSGRLVSKGAAAWEELTMLDGLVRASLFVLALLSRVGGGRGSQRAGSEHGEPQEETSSSNLLASAWVEAEGPQGCSVHTACQVSWELYSGNWRQRVGGAQKMGHSVVSALLPLQEAQKG